MEIKDMIPQFSDSPIRYLYEPCPVALKPNATTVETARIDVDIYEVGDGDYTLTETLENYVSIEFPPDSDNRFQEIDLSQVVSQLVVNRMKIITSISDLMSKEVFCPMQRFEFTLKSIDGLTVSTAYVYEPIYGTRPPIALRLQERTSFDEYITNPFKVFGIESLSVKDELNISTSIPISVDTYKLSSLNISTSTPTTGVEAIVGVLYFRTILGAVVQFPIDFYDGNTSHAFSGDLGSTQFEAGKTPKEVFAGSTLTVGNKFNKLSASVSETVSIEMYQLDVDQARVLQMISGSPYVGIHFNGTPDDSIEMMLLTSASIPKNSITEKVDAKLSLTPLSVQSLVF